MLQSSPQLWLRPLQGVCATGLSERELAWGRQLAPAQRRRYWQSRAALRQLVARCVGCEAGAVPLHSPPGAPPRLEASAGCVSLSHSGAMLLVGWWSLPFGLDLEPARRPLAAAAIARRYFPSGEWDELRGLETEPLRQAVLRSWVLKEAAIKWRHRSLASELADWHYHHRCGVLRHRGEGLTPPCHWGERQGWLWGLVGAATAPTLALHR
jgi:4'-phosphopantetheinyl transferase